MSTRRRHALLVIVLSSMSWACTSPEPTATPPGAPQKDEMIISGEDDPVSIQCAGDYGGVGRTPGRGTPRRILVTSNPQWGTVWRADAAPLDDPGSLWRIVCWKNGALLRPLEMSDASQSIPPLP